MPLAELARRHPRALLLALALAVALSFQGSRGLYETTEGRYAESALEMIQGGRWLEPTLAGRPHWTKPPLAYWAIASGVGLAGPNGWGARLSNVLVFCLTVLAVAGIGAALWDPATGLLAGLVYLSSLFPAAAAAVVSTDTLLTFWEILAVYLYVRAWREEDPARSRRAIRAMWLVFALAFLTKGPPALLPLLAIVVFGRLSRSRVRLGDPPAVAAFAVLASSWYAWVSARHPGLLSYFVGDEVIGRALSNEFKRNPEWYKPLLIYLPSLVLGQGAWLLAGARLPSRAGLWPPPSLWRATVRGGAGSFLLLWFLLPLAVLSLSSSRLPLYVLPLYAPIALAIARGLARWNGAGAVPRALAVAIPSVAMIVALKAVAAYAAPPSEGDMGRLYAAVLRAAGSPADYRSFDEEKLYGLQFYLGGALRRVSRAPAPWADERLEEALEAMRRQPERTHVVVSSGRAAEELDAALTGAGLPHRHLRAGSRELFVVAGAAPTALLDVAGRTP